MSRIFQYTPRTKLNTTTPCCIHFSFGRMTDCCVWKRGKNDALFDPVDKRDYCGTCWQLWVQSKLEKHSKKRPRVRISTSSEPKEAETKEIGDSRQSVDDNEIKEACGSKKVVDDDDDEAVLEVRVGKYECGKIVLDKSRTDEVPFLKHDPADNCETPLQAYRDLAPLLRQLCAQMGKAPSELVIYDPYYCDGTVKRHLSSLGFTNVYNEPEDFYTTIGTEKGVVYDVVVTNPPYSGNHVERMFKYLFSRGKPFFCLIPNYVYTKPFYSDIININMQPRPYPFYLTPETPRKYVYETPAYLRDVKAAKLKTAPFVSFWYCWTCPSYTRDLYQWYVTQRSRTRTDFALTLACTEYHLPDSFKDSNDKTRRKARRKKKNISKIHKALRLKRMER